MIRNFFGRISERKSIIEKTIHLESAEIDRIVLSGIEFMRISHELNTVMFRNESGNLVTLVYNTRAGNPLVLDFVGLQEGV